MGFETEKGVQEVSRIVVCDTGPLIHLGEAEAIHLLRLAGDIFIPPAVAIELKRNLSKGKFPNWIQIQPLDAQYKAQTKIWIRDDRIGY